MISFRFGEDFEAIMDDVLKNEKALHAFAKRLHDRFGYTMWLPKSGNPVHIKGYHNGPYWGVLVPENRSLPHKQLPKVVYEDFRALVAQGARLRKQALEIMPRMHHGYVFPLNVVYRLNGEI